MHFVAILENFKHFEPSLLDDKLEEILFGMNDHSTVEWKMLLELDILLD